MQIFLAPVKCQILNNLLGNVKKEENSACALPTAFSTVLCEFPQKKDFFVYKNFVRTGGVVEKVKNKYKHTVMKVQAGRARGLCQHITPAGTGQHLCIYKLTK